MDSRQTILPRIRIAKIEAVTQKAIQAGGWKSRYKEVDRTERQIPQFNVETRAGDQQWSKL